MAEGLVISEGLIATESEGAVTDIGIRGDLDLRGRLSSSFEGFAVEDQAWTATEMYSTATMLTTSNYPRLSFSETGTTSAFIGAFNFPAWYTDIDIHIGWTNEGAGSGTVIWAWNLRKVLVGQAITSGTLISTGFPAQTAPGNGVLTTTILAETVPIGSLGSFGYTLGFEIARIGDSDTLANAAGLVAVGFSKTN